MIRVGIRPGFERSRLGAASRVKAVGPNRGPDADVSPDDACAPGENPTPRVDCARADPVRAEMMAAVATAHRRGDRKRSAFSMGRESLFCLAKKCQLSAGEERSEEHKAELQ